MLAVTTVLPLGENCALLFPLFHCQRLYSPRFPGCRADDTPEKTDQFRHMMIECEKVSLLPDPLANGLQLLAVSQLGSKLIHCIKKNSGTELLHQGLRSDECAVIGLLQHRQTGRRKGA